MKVEVTCVKCGSKTWWTGGWGGGTYRESADFVCRSCVERIESQGLAVVHQSKTDIAKIEANRDVAIRAAEVKRHEVDVLAQVKKEEISKHVELGKYQAEQQMLVQTAAIKSETEMALAKSKLEDAKIQSDTAIKIAEMAQDTKKYEGEKMLEATKIQFEIAKINSDAKKYEEKKKIEAYKEKIKLERQRLEYEKMKLQFEHEEKFKKEEMKYKIKEKKHDMVDKLLQKDCDAEQMVMLLKALTPSTPSNTKQKTKTVNHYPLLNLRSLTVLKWKDNEEKQHRLNLINAMKNKWESMCDLMEIPMDTVETLVRDCQGDEEKCCRAILMYWLENGSATWEDLINLLDELELDEIKVKLEEALQ